MKLAPFIHGHTLANEDHKMQLKARRRNTEFRVFCYIIGTGIGINADQLIMISISHHVACVSGLVCLPLLSVYQDGLGPR